MPDDDQQQNSGTTDEQPPAGTDDTTGTDSGEASPPSEKDLPEWGRKELSRARAEAANYRTQLREAQDALKTAKSPEDFAKVQADLTERAEKAERAALVATVARKFNLPDDLAEVLQGSTAEELEAHAKKLQRYANPNGQEHKRLRGGLDPSSDAYDDADPVEVAKRALARRQ